MMNTKELNDLIENALAKGEEINVTYNVGTKAYEVREIVEIKDQPCKH